MGVHSARLTRRLDNSADRRAPARIAEGLVWQLFNRISIRCKFIAGFALASVGTIGLGGFAVEHAAAELRRMTFTRLPCSAMDSQRKPKHDGLDWADRAVPCGGIMPSSPSPSGPAANK